MDSLLVIILRAWWVQKPAVVVQELMYSTNHFCSNTAIMCCFWSIGLFVERGKANHAMRTLDCQRLNIFLDPLSFWLLELGLAGDWRCCCRDYIWSFLLGSLSIVPFYLMQAQTQNPKENIEISWEIIKKKFMSIFHWRNGAVFDRFVAWIALNRMNAEFGSTALAWIYDRISNFGFSPFLACLGDYSGGGRQLW